MERVSGGGLVLSLAVRAELEAWMRAGYPHETCGVLVGELDAGGTTRVAWARQARNLNVERAHDRYELDPGDHLVADTEARREGLEIVGYWHSHPDHPARPSEMDLERAWPNCSYLIASLTAGGVQDWRSWRLVDDDFVEERIAP